MTMKKEFLSQEVPILLAKLTEDQVPAFGLMTPQHMIEHLTGSIKYSIKRHGEPDPTLAEKQVGFKRFIENGAVLKHRPSDKTAADLPPYKYESLAEAIPQIPVAIDRFYTHFEAQPDFISYNVFMGELNFEDLELFHYQHVRYHLWQFGLLSSYP